MALYEGFKATTVWKAFILNSIIAALVILIAMIVKDNLDTYKDVDGRIVTRTSSFGGLTATLIITFLASLLAFTAMHFTFDFGQGMLVN